MTWADTTLGLILKHRAYMVFGSNMTTLNLITLIQQQMSKVEVVTPYLIATIEADLATLETLDASLTTEKGSTNAALIQADVLRWAEGSKTAGIASRYEEIRQRVVAKPGDRR
jgi:hypothetical protein